MCRVRDAKTEARLTVTQEPNKIVGEMKNVEAVEEQPSATFTCTLAR